MYMFCGGVFICISWTDSDLFTVLERASIYSESKDATWLLCGDAAISAIDYTWPDVMMVKQQTSYSSNHRHCEVR